jgi:hypothetical protein
MKKKIIDRRVIDITELGCPQLADLSLPAISCTFASHNKSNIVCALRSAYSLAHLDKLYSVPSSACISLMFSRCGRYTDVIFSQRERNKARVHLPE